MNSSWTWVHFSSPSSSYQLIFQKVYSIWFFIELLIFIFSIGLIKFIINKVVNKLDAFAVRELSNILVVYILVFYGWKIAYKFNRGLVLDCIFDGWDMSNGCSWSDRRSCNIMLIDVIIPPEWWFVKL
jgi:hypothetical protein